MEDEKNTRLYTSDELAKRLKVSRQYISTIIKKGYIKYYRVGQRYIRFTEEMIQDFLEGKYKS